MKKPVAVLAAIAVLFSFSFAAGENYMSASRVANYFPDYTCTIRSDYTVDVGSWVSYWKISDGTLYVRRAKFDGDAKVIAQYDCMPVPLSEALFSQLTEENFNSLLEVSPYNSIFWQIPDIDPIDRSQMDVEGKILDSVLTETGIFLITKNDAGQRYLWLEQLYTDGYKASVCKELPSSNPYFDTIHAGEDTIYLSFGEDATITLAKPNYIYPWRISRFWLCSEYGDFSGSVYPWGINIGSAYEPKFIYGNLQRVFEIENVDFMNCPSNVDELRRQINRENFAVVSNPNPADRLNLRKEHTKDSATLGKFYNGTPVSILSTYHDKKTGTDWCNVEIGSRPNMYGWMMKDFLVFGEAMDEVKPAFPQLIVTEDLYGKDELMVYETKELKGTYDIGSKFFVIGILEGKAWIIMDDYGQTGYIPLNKLWEGNG